MTLNELAKECHTIAYEKGWWDKPRDFGEITSLIHTEVSEGYEAYRESGTPGAAWKQEDGKPEGVAYEWADVIIRILDAARYYGFDMDKVIKEKMEYNETRPHRHGGKHA